MYEEDLYVVAYERIKSKPGNMTPGTDGETLDGFSLKEIQNIIHCQGRWRFMHVFGEAFFCEEERSWLVRT